MPPYYQSPQMLIIGSELVRFWSLVDPLIRALTPLALILNGLSPYTQVGPEGRARTGLLKSILGISFKNEWAV
jgi:hypothetical protein